MDFIEVKTASNRTDLAFDQDVSQALKEMSDSFDCEAMVLVKVGPECILNPEVMGKKGIDILPQSYTNMADEVSLLQTGPAQQK